MWVNNGYYDENEIKELALQYYELVQRGQRESLPPIRAKIWALIWYMRRVVYKLGLLEDYKAFSENGYNSCGSADEYLFLDNVFLDNIVSIIDLFCTSDNVNKYNRNFMRFFVGVFANIARRAASDIIYKNPQNFRWIKLRNNVNEGFMYAKPSVNTRIEDSLSPVTSHDAMKRYISLRLSEDGEWYYIESKQHGRLVYVRTCDFDLIEPVINHAIDDPGQSDVGYDDAPCDNNPYSPEDELTNKYIIRLLATIQLFYQMRNRTLNDNIDIDGLGRLQCYKLLYTETMTKLLKSVYEIIGESLSSVSETLAIAVSDTGFLDYILTVSGCRTFLSIASTRLKSLYEITKREGDGVTELDFPIPSSVYYCYLTEIKGLSQTEGSVKVSISRCRVLFKRQFRLLCNVR